VVFAYLNLVVDEFVFVQCQMAAKTWCDVHCGRWKLIMIMFHLSHYHVQLKG